MIFAINRLKEILGINNNQIRVKTSKEQNPTKKNNKPKALKPSVIKPRAVRNTLKKYGQLFYSIGSSGFDSATTWLIKSLIPASSFGVFFGPSSSLKSFLAIDICCHISTGKTWGNQRVNKGAVVYVAAEGKSGASKRIKAWEIANQTKVDQLYVLGESVMLADDENQTTLILSIQNIEKEHNEKVNLIVIDTLARCYSGDENTTRDMTKFISGCDNIRSTIDSALLCIHHSGRDESRGGRGSSALLAACDYEFKIKRIPNSKEIILTNTKQKDSDEAPILNIDFDIINLGIQCEDNKPITSLARVNDIIVSKHTSSTNARSQKSELLAILKEQFNGEATRAELRQAFYPNVTKLSEAQRQKLSRELKKLEDSESIKIISSSSTNLDKIIAFNLQQ